MIEVGQRRVLYIDLGKQKAEVKVHSDCAETLGGVGLAVFLYEANQEKDALIFSISPTTGLFPFMAGTCAVFKSPLTQDWAEEYVGGWLGAVMHSARLDAIVLYGVTPHPQYLVVTDHEVSFRSASSLVGKGTLETYSFLHENEGLPGKRSILTIGQAAEKAVRYASCNVDMHFEFRRYGVGTKFASFGLKAFVITGTEELVVEDRHLHKQLCDTIYKSFEEQKNSGLYPGYERSGSLAGFDSQKKIGGLPTNNYQVVGRSATSLSEESLLSPAEGLGVASFNSPLIHHNLYAVRNNFIPLDYESVVCLGPLLGIHDLNSILYLRYLALDYGFDPVSLGVVLAYLTELRSLTFSNVESYRDLIRGLLEQTDDWALYLARGVREGVQHLGGEDFALQIAGCEMAPFHNGYGTLLSQIIGPTRSLYASEGHMVDFSLLGAEFAEEDLVDGLVQKEMMTSLLDSLSVVYYARGIYADYPLVFSVLDSLGLTWSQEDIENFGEDLYYKKHRLRKSFGIDYQSEPFLPTRVFTVPSAYGMLKRERLRSQLDYYKTRWLPAENSNEQQTS